jgi:hypothetical protein
VVWNLLDDNVGDWRQRVGSFDVVIHGFAYELLKVWEVHCALPAAAEVPFVLYSASVGVVVVLVTRMTREADKRPEHDTQSVDCWLPMSFTPFKNFLAALNL